MRRRQSPSPAGWSLAGDKFGFPHCGLTGVFRASSFGRFRHSADRAVASNSAAALAASKVSAEPPTTRSLSPPPFLALRRTSHVGTLSSVKTNSMKPSTSVETAGLGQREAGGARQRRCRLSVRAQVVHQVVATFSDRPRSADGASRSCRHSSSVRTSRPAGSRPCSTAFRNRTLECTPFTPRTAISRPRSALSSTSL